MRELPHVSSLSIDFHQHALHLDETAKNNLDLAPLRHFKLWVEDQIKLKNIELSNNQALEQLYLHTCKSLASLDGFSSLDALLLLSVSETMLDIEAILEHGLPASLSHLHFRTGKTKADEAIEVQLAQLGYCKQLLPF